MAEADLTKHPIMKELLTAFAERLATDEAAVPFAMSQAFVDRVTSSDEDEPSVMGAGHVDSIKRIAEEMVSSSKAVLQGDGEFTHDAIDDWAHRIMCFATHTNPPAHAAKDVGA